MAGSGRSRRKSSAEAGVLLGAVLAAVATPVAGADLVPYVVDGDTILRSLTGSPGDAARGRAIVVNRQVGLCLLCHTGPFPEERLQGNLAPSLAGSGSRWTEGELRLLVVDTRRLNPDSIMPSYYRTEGLTRVAPSVAGKPLLNAAQVEDVVAFLETLRDGGDRAP